MLYSGRFVNLEFTKLLLCILLFIKPLFDSSSNCRQKKEKVRKICFLQ